MIQLLFVVAVALMVAVQPNAYKEVAVLLAPSFYRRRMRQVLSQCGEALSSWMGGVLISSLCVALLAGIGLSLLGVKLVVANALLAGLLNIIPNVGPTLSTVFPMSVALLVSPWKALAVLGLYVLVQNLESYVITPSVMHHQVKLLPGLTLAAQFVFTVLFGPLGLLLALPLAVCLQVVIREVLIHDVLDPWRRQRPTDMNGRGLIGLLALVVLGLLAWELRWVLLVLFGAVVLAVALDVPVTWLRRYTPLNRPQSLLVVVAMLLLGGWQLGELLLPELIEQVQQLTPACASGDQSDRLSSWAAWRCWRASRVVWRSSPRSTNCSHWGGSFWGLPVAPPMARSSCY